jgi:ERCC4-type nuclease
LEVILSGSNDILIANFKEKGNEVTAFLEKEGIQVRYTALRLIDYLIAGRVAVVRRTVESFLADLSNKMVYRTAPEFKRSFPDPLYIVEGTAPAATISATTPGRSGITYLTFVHRIPIIFASTPEETAKYIALMMKQAEFASAPTDSEDSPGENAATESADAGDEAIVLEADVQIKLLAALPGLTEGNAVALLARFGSLKAVFEAPEKELAKVKGIGAKKAKIIVTALTTSTAPKNNDKPARRKPAHPSATR